MKHFVLGLIFNKSKTRILLVEKNKPEWMAGHWNGIGGKVEDNETPMRAIERECLEEISYSYSFEHVITFVCPGGTAFVFKAICVGDDIKFNQTEDEELRAWLLENLPTEMMTDLRWIIPLSLSSVQFPVIIQQNKLGVYT